MAIDAPAARPANPRFSSGPCAKIPTFSLDLLSDAALGRSHRAAVGKAKLKDAIETTREVLGIPADYKIGIVPASDTGAVEMALWSLLGARKATMCALASKRIWRSKPCRAGQWILCRRCHRFYRVRR